ncbi:MAG TPA: hypothetical protein VGK27_02740 [Candidatus Deferrimicrobiaceae bacterium]
MEILKLIAPVINNMIKIIVAFTSVCLVLSVSMLGSAANKTYSSYTIEKAWFDAGYIYILYKKSDKTVKYSLSDIEGTITKENSKLFMCRYSKPSGWKKHSVQFDNIYSDGSLIYKDSDFTISKELAGIAISGRSFSKSITSCDQFIWTYDWPIRLKGQIFSCGVLYDAYGNKVWEVPKYVMNKIEDKRRYMLGRKKLFPGIALRLVAVISNYNLLLTWVDPTSMISEIEFGIVPIGKTDKMNWVIKTLPIAKKGYQIMNGSKIYSPTAGFVLEKDNGEDSGILILSEKKEYKIALPGGYSYLLIDGEGNTIYRIVHKDLTSPIIELDAIKY